MAWEKHGKFVKVIICQGTAGGDKNSVLTIIKGIARGYYQRTENKIDKGKG